MNRRNNRVQVRGKKATLTHIVYSREQVKIRKSRKPRTIAEIGFAITAKA